MHVQVTDAEIRIGKTSSGRSADNDDNWQAVTIDVWAPCRFGASIEHAFITSRDVSRCVNICAITASHILSFELDLIEGSRGCMQPTSVCQLPSPATAVSNSRCGLAAMAQWDAGDIHLWDTQLTFGEGVNLKMPRLNDSNPSNKRVPSNTGVDAIRPLLVTPLAKGTVNNEFYLVFAGSCDGQIICWKVTRGQITGGEEGPIICACAVNIGKSFVTFFSSSDMSHDLILAKCGESNFLLQWPAAGDRITCTPVYTNDPLAVSRTSIVALPRKTFGLNADGSKYMLLFQNGDVAVATLHLQRNMHWNLLNVGHGQIHHLLHHAASGTIVVAGLVGRSSDCGLRFFDCETFELLKTVDVPALFEVVSLESCIFADRQCVSITLHSSHRFSNFCQRVDAYGGHPFDASCEDSFEPTSVMSLVEPVRLAGVAGPSLHLRLVARHELVGHSSAPSALLRGRLLAQGCDNRIMLLCQDPIETYLLRLVRIDYASVDFGAIIGLASNDDEILVVNHWGSGFSIFRCSPSPNSPTLETLCLVRKGSLGITLCHHSSIFLVETGSLCRDSFVVVAYTSTGIVSAIHVCGPDVLTSATFAVDSKILHLWKGSLDSLDILTNNNFLRDSREQEAVITLMTSSGSVYSISLS